MAVLKANFDVNAHSYLDNFVPFALASVRSISKRSVTASEVRDQLKLEFGLDIPEHAVASVLGRAAREGKVIRSNFAYSLTDHEIDAPNLMSGRQDLLRKHNALVEGLINFASQRLGRDLDFEVADAAILDHIDEQGVPLALRLVHCPEPRPLRLVGDPSIEHIVVEYIEHVAQSDPMRYEYLEAVFQGSMLTSALYLPDPSTVSQRFHDATTFYFDTPLLLRVIGLAGTELGGPAVELADMLKRQGARLACFQDTLEELRRVLMGAAADLQKGGSGRPSGPTDVVGHCVRENIRSSDLRVIIDQLERKLGDLGFATMRPPKMEVDLSIDETKFTEQLSADINYRSENALRHDLEAVTAIHRIRRGWRPNRLENCRAVFVTTNGSLVGVTRRHFRRGGEFSWPLAMKDSDLATILWLKEPAAAPDLPRKRIIADCYAALRPSPALWERYLDEVDRLNMVDFSDADLAVLRYSIPAQQALTSVTGGNLDAVSSDTVAKVLADAKAAIVAPEVSRREALLEQFERTKSDGEAQLEAGQIELEKAKVAVQRVERAAREQAERQDARLRRQARLRATKRARREAIVLFIGGAVLVAAGVLLATLGILVPGPELPLAIRIPAIALTVVTVAFAVANGVWGWSIRSGHDSYRTWRAAKLEERFIEEFCFDDPLVANRS